MITMLSVEDIPEFPSVASSGSLVHGRPSAHIAGHGPYIGVRTTRIIQNISDVQHVLKILLLLRLRSVIVVPGDLVKKVGGFLPDVDTGIVIGFEQDGKVVVVCSADGIEIWQRPFVEVISESR